MIPTLILGCIPSQFNARWIANRQLIHSLSPLAVAADLNVLVGDLSGPS